MQVEEHHKRGEVATNRPAYREARREKAVKVYTVNQESRYLLVQNVHALGVTQELLQLFSLYGDIQEYRILDEYPSEPYTDVYWVKFVDIAAARVAKRKLDDRSFFGKSLHVSYAPEFESVEETREKLKERKDTIAKKLKASHIREKKAAKDQHQREVASRTEQLPQQECTTNNVTSTSTTAASRSNTPSLDTHSKTFNTTQPSAISPQFLLHPSSSSSQSKLENPQQAVMPQLQPNIYHVPPPPPLPSDPILQGIHGHVQMAQYPSQAMHKILGGALPTSSTTQHGRTDSSRHHPPPATTIGRATSRGGGGSERDRAPKRRLESHPDVVRERSKEGGLYDTSGLSKSQRLSAFLSTSSDPSSSSTLSASATSTEELPVKKKGPDHERTKERRTDKMAQQGSTSTEKIPVPNEGYFPVHQQLPPLQSGNRSVDTTVQTVRKRMDKVWNEAIHSPNIPQPKKPKKRKRI